jgi:hypothetical protein
MREKMIENNSSLNPKIIKEGRKVFIMEAQKSHSRKSRIVVTRV